MVRRLFGKSFARWYTRLMRNTKYRWLVLIGTLVYLLSPIDISPDFLPIIGWIDDGLIATIAVAEISQLLLERKRSQRFQPQTRATAPHHSATAAPVIDVEATPLR